MRARKSKCTQRKLPTQACAHKAPHAVVVGKRHVRECLATTLAQFGFVTQAYDAYDDLDGVLSNFGPDLFLMWVCRNTKLESSATIKRLSEDGYKGHVLLLGAEGCSYRARIQALGKRRGLEMLEPLSTPICDKRLWSVVRSLCDEETAFPDIDLLSAIKSQWLEVWYQPKFDSRTFSIAGAEALVRMRHPKWGIIEPSRFIPAADEDALVALSEFVMGKAMSDWRHFVLDYEGLEIAVNIPLRVITHSNCMQHVMERLPQDQRFYRALIEADASDVIENPGLAKSVATQLTRHHLALSIDDVAEDWIELCAVEDAPLAEIKVDRSVISGCAQNEIKRSTCKRILEFARRIGVRTVAEGVEGRPDLLAVRELGFDLLQGYVCGRPLDRMQFSSLIREQWCASRQFARAA
jgi:EAL domain-containing protein (putative c-di-GMP-specific phosphodiesterase class I)